MSPDLNNYIVKANSFLKGFLIPFWNTLNTFQKCVVTLAILPFFPYVINLQLLELFSIISQIIKGNSFDFLRFVILMTETFIIFYTTALIIQFKSEEDQRVVSLPIYTQQSHFCLETRQIPIHLLTVDKPLQSEQDDFEHSPFFNRYSNMLKEAGINNPYNNEGALTNEALEVITKASEEELVDQDPDEEGSVNLLDYMRGYAQSDKMTQNEFLKQLDSLDSQDNVIPNEDN